MVCQLFCIQLTPYWSHTTGKYIRKPITVYALLKEKTGYKDARMCTFISLFLSPIGESEGRWSLIYSFIICPLIMVDNFQRWLINSCALACEPLFRSRAGVGFLLHLYCFDQQKEGGSGVLPVPEPAFSSLHLLSRRDGPYAEAWGAHKWTLLEPSCPVQLPRECRWVTPTSAAEKSPSF
jgi:hypothetical protein